MTQEREATTADGAATARDGDDRRGDDRNSDDRAGAETKPQRMAAIWPRAAVMVLFAVLFAAAETVLLLAAVLQGLWLAVTGAPNPHVARFGGALGRWAGAVVAFLTCASEERPFPWGRWPSEPEAPHAKSR